MTETDAKASKAGGASADSEDTDVGLGELSASLTVQVAMNRRETSCTSLMHDTGYADARAGLHSSGFAFSNLDWPL